MMIMSLSGADLRYAYLPYINLENDNLAGADLKRANLRAARLKETNLGGADLRDADLTGADLSDPNVTEAQLATCKSLEDATMPDGQKYDAWRQTRRNFKLKEPGFP
jgi:uncharacterized protein YjbI with pentapeptide repeats